MSRKNKTFRAFLHQNFKPTPQQIWDAAWEAQGKKAYTLRMAELEAEVGRLKGLRVYERDSGELVHPDSTITVPVGIHMELIERADAAEAKVARVEGVLADLQSSVFEVITYSVICKLKAALQVQEPEHE